MGGNEPPKNWFSRTKYVSLPQLRYEFAKVSHSCGHTPYASASIAHTNTAPAIVAAHVAGSADFFGRRIMTNAIPIPMASNNEAQMSRPACTRNVGPQSKMLGTWRASGLALVSGIAPVSPTRTARRGSGAGQPRDELWSAGVSLLVPR